MEILLFLMIFAAFVALIVFIFRASLNGKRRRHAQWAAMGERYGLEVTPLPEGIFAQLQFLIGMTGSLHGQSVRLQEELRQGAGRNRRQRGGVSIELGSVSVGTGVRSGRSTRNEQQATGLYVSFETAPYLSRELDASRENVLHRLVKPITKGDQQIGDEALDRAIYFKVLTDGDREVLLRPEVREVLLRIFDLGASVKLYTGTLTLDFVRVPKDAAIAELLADLEALAQALPDASGSGRHARW